MFDTLKVQGDDRARFCAPWGTTYDDFQSKSLCDLVGEPEPSLDLFVLRGGRLFSRDRGSVGDPQPIEGSGVVEVYAFAREREEGGLYSDSGWVEWNLTVKDGRVVDVQATTMRPPDGA